MASLENVEIEWHKATVNAFNQLYQYLLDSEGRDFIRLIRTRGLQLIRSIMYLLIMKRNVSKIK